MTRSKGFTLIEALVATALFAFVISSMAGVYISTLKIDRKTRAQRAMAQNARFITEFITKEVRSGRINYASYPSGLIASTNQSLYVVNEAFELEHIYPSAAFCSILSPCDIMLTKNGSTPTALNSPSVKITRYGVYIKPAGDPFTAAKTYNEQPNVTIVMEIMSSYGANATDLVRMNLQTTVAVRTYPAR